MEPDTYAVADISVQRLAIILDAAIHLNEVKDPKARKITLQAMQSLADEIVPRPKGKPALVDFRGNPINE